MVFLGSGPLPLLPQSRERLGERNHDIVWLKRRLECPP